MLTKPPQAPPPGDSGDRSTPRRLAIEPYAGTPPPPTPAQVHTAPTQLRPNPKAQHAEGQRQDRPKPPASPPKLQHHADDSAGVQAHPSASRHWRPTLGWRPVQRTNTAHRLPACWKSRARAARPAGCGEARLAAPPASRAAQGNQAERAVNFRAVGDRLQRTACNAARVGATNDHRVRASAPRGIRR